MVSSPQKKLHIVKQSEKSDATIVDSAIRAKNTNTAVGADRSLNPGFYFDFSRAVPQVHAFHATSLKIWKFSVLFQ
jgi:hypothetical protein